MIDVLADFAPFLAAGALAATASRWIRRLGWTLLVPAAMGVAGFVWVAHAAGYGGWSRELLIGLLAAVVLALPLGLLLATHAPKRPRPSGKPLLVFVLLPLMVGVMMPWTSRVHWVTKLAWSCDGVIVEKYRSHNHQAPTLVVRNHNGSLTTLEGISAAVWGRAAAEDRLRKESGRADAQLNQQTVELVLRTGW
jgi:hypothetical protein